MRDVIFTGKAFSNDGGMDPDKLSDPKKRKDWFDSELKRIQYEERLGELIPAEQAAGHIVEVFKQIAISVDTTDDVIKRDASLQTKQIAIMQRIQRRTAYGCHTDASDYFFHVWLY